MKFRNLFKRTALLSLAFSIALGGTFATFGANASSDVRKIFTEELDSAELAANKWLKSKPDSTAIGIGAIGKSAFNMTADGSGKVALQYDKLLSFETGDAEEKPAAENIVAKAADGKLAMQYGKGFTFDEATSGETIPAEKSITVTPDGSGKLALQYDKQVELTGNQFLEFSVTLDNMKGAPETFMNFSGTKASTAADIKPEESEGIGVKVPNVSAALVNVYTTASDCVYTKGWGGRFTSSDKDVSLQTYNGNYTLGLWDSVIAADTAALNYSLKYRVYADGRAVAYIARPGQNNWCTLFSKGFEASAETGWQWVQLNGGNAIAKGYPQLVISGASGDVKITELNIGVYDSQTWVTPEATGTPVENSGYTEEFGAESECKCIAGTAKIINREESDTKVYPKQFVEFTATLKNLSGTPSVFMGYSGVKASVASEIDAAKGEGFELKVPNKSVVKGRLHSANAGAEFRNAWSGVMYSKSETYADLISYDGSGTKGITKSETEYSVKQRIYADGTAILFVADAGENNWFPIGVTGYTHDGSNWSKTAGFKPMQTIYPQIILSDVSGDVTITELSTAMYTYEGFEIPEGSLVEGSDFTEDFADGESEFKFIAGEATFGSEAKKPKQFVEFALTLKNVAEAPTVFMGFSAAKAATNADMNIAAGEGVSVRVANKDALMANVYSADPDCTFQDGWCAPARKVGGEEMSMHTVNGNGLLGINKTSTAYSLKYRFYSDGRAFVYVANAGENNWCPVFKVGYVTNTSTWKEEPTTGMKVTPSGYPQIVIENAPENMRITELSAGLYNYEGDVDAHDQGTMVENTGYTEDFADLESEYKLLAGTAALSAAEQGIVIDNAANDDLLVKKTPLSEPEDARTDLVYDIKAELYAEKISGTANAVVYIGGDDDKLTNAAMLKFGSDADGRLILSVEGAELIGNVSEAVTKAEAEMKFILNIRCGGDGTNTVVIDNEEVLSFRKETIKKFIGFGTTGADADNPAKFAILGASIAKHSYTPGVGGDFVETFDDGMYNEKNIAIYTQITEPSPDNVFLISDGKVVCTECCAYTSVISSKQIYGDFEFEFEISELGDNPEGVDFALSWGRPFAECDYAAGGNGILVKDGFLYPSFLNTGEVEASSMKHIAFPTGEKDSDGKAVTSQSFNDYDFSEGNLCFKIVKEETEVRIYLYTADSAADSEGRTKPVMVIKDDYSGAGAVGVCAVPTGRNMELALDKFSVKNLDVYKTENPVVGAESDRIELKFETEGPGDTSVDDPLNSANSSGGGTVESGCNGCGSVISVGAATATVVTAFGAFVVKRRKRDD